MEAISIAEISRLGLKDVYTTASALIIDVKHLASYNWIKAQKVTPTIAVPGSPDLWAPPHRPFRVPKDTGHVYIAQNAARHPDSPLEPLFRALYIALPSFDIASIDVVTDRNNIRKLLAFINPRWSGNKQEDFTIHVEITNGTAIFCRVEAKTEDFVGPKEFRGFGHSFEKKCTKLQLKDSTGHHRIISYEFGGLKFLVRHETDGYIGVAGAQSASKQASVADDFSSALSNLSLSSKDSTLGNSKLVIKKQGQEVLLSSTLEVKTRVSHKPLAFEDVVSQLWASQTPKLVRAYHTKGEFAVPEVEDVADQVKVWEEQNQEDLRLLAALISKIRETVKESGGRAILKYDAAGDKLALSKLEGEKMLPADLYAKWEGSGELGVEVDVEVVGGLVQG